MRARTVFESTDNYWPGYSDDGTSDNLTDIRHKTSKIQNDELKKKEKSVMRYGKTDQDKFFQKWMYANMILTSLQDGFYINKELLNKALEIYKSLLDDPKIEEYLQDTKNPKYFIESIELILDKLSKKIKDDKGQVYAPGFLDIKDQDRLKIDSKFGKNYWKAEKQMNEKFKAESDPIQDMGIGYSKRTLDSKSFKILQFIGSKGKEGASLTEIQHFIWTELDGYDEESFWKKQYVQGYNYKTGKTYPSSARKTRGHWNTQLFGGPSYHEGLLHKYCVKNPDTKKWVLKKMPDPKIPMYQWRKW